MAADPIPENNRDQRLSRGTDHHLFQHRPIEYPFLRRARRFVHHAGLALFKGQAHILNPVGHQVQPQQLDCHQRQRPIHQQVEREEHDQAQSIANQKPNDLSHIGVSKASFFHPGDDGGKIVIDYNNIGILFGQIRA